MNISDLTPDQRLCLLVRHPKFTGLEKRGVRPPIAGPFWRIYFDGLHSVDAKTIDAAVTAALEALEVKGA